MSARSGVQPRQRATGRDDQGALRPAALTVRPVCASDLVPLSFFFDAVLRRDYFMRRGQLEEIIRSRRHRVYVAEIDAVLVGAAITTRGARLINALVHPAYRGLGIGRELIRCSEATEVRAKLDMSSGDPRGFYRSLGFASTGTRNRKGNIEILRLPNAARRNGTQARAGKNRNSKCKRAGRNGVAMKDRSRK